MRKEKTGAPGEIRTPDLLLRRLSKAPWPSKNQALIAVLARHCAALSSPIAHISAHTQSPRPYKTNMNAGYALLLMYSRHLHNTEHPSSFETCPEEICREAREAIVPAGTPSSFPT